MPPLGDQHLNAPGKIAIANPFQEPQRHVAVYTAQEIATLQSRLEKQLGPEYLATRTGPSGQKVHYVPGEKCIQLANEVFGFNGWSSQIIECQVDFVDENPQTMKVSLGLSVVVRVTLRDGTFHEDVGYGHIENCKGKAAAFEKAKKEGTTDALKRALRSFGNVLGNCIYDKEYLKLIAKVKPFVPKWSADNLHRHSTFGASPMVKRELVQHNEVVEQNEVTAARAQDLGRRESDQEFLESLVVNNEEYFDDEFGDFDEADFNVPDPESHPDEAVLSESTPPEPVSLRHVIKTLKPTGGTSQDQNQKKSNINQPTNPTNLTSALTRSNGPSAPHPPSAPYPPPAPQTPTSCPSRSDSEADPPSRSEINYQNRQMKPPSVNTVTRRYLTRASAPASPAPLHKPSCDLPEVDTVLAMPPQGNGFFSARAATFLPDPKPDEKEPPTGPPTPIPSHAPAFNPYAESPSIRKTPGVDHKSSKPLTRDLKHVPGASQTSATAAAPSGGAGVGIVRANVLNPSLDNARRIGAPCISGPLGMAGGRGGNFRMPTKRVVDVPGTGARVPLEMLNANGHMIDTGDRKRQRLDV